MSGRRSLPLALLTALAFAACSAPDAGAPEGACASSADCDGGACVEGACVSGTPEDDASLIDLGGEEDASEDAADAAPDTPLLDIAEDGEESDAPEEGGFLWPCEGDSDCDSGFCVETDSGDVCTVLCDGECPDPTWGCRLYAGAGGDVVRLCVPPNEIACDPCSNDTECGFATDLCLDLADGSFCGEDCAEGRGCAEGFRCDEVLRDVDGASVVFEQCVPESGFCGDCVDNDRDGFGEGEGCRGVDCADDDDARFEGAPELCNGLDDDCDDEEDEGFDLATDARHCGSCGNACEAARAEVACQEGVCAIVSCEEGWTDTNGAFEDGCENECTPTNEGVELCDEVDNDCDGEVDEDFDLDSDPLNCRVCDNVCLIPQGEPACAEGACVVAACDPGSVDLNGLPEDGCEYACAPTEDPAEVCDGVDNDCDGVIDNDIDLATSTEHCGACGEACDAPNAESACVEGGCTLVGCNAGFYDVDGLYETGCEYACTFLGASELCDDEDQDCDGRVDEGFTLATDEDNCGSCGRVCALADAEEVCIDGVCEVQACLGNYADCDMESENGCEVDLRSDEDNCGACGDTCDLPNAFSRCDEGACVVTGCVGTWQDCDGQAFNGCESNRIADPLNCGFCSNQCLPANGSGTCNAGFCAIVSCEPEYADCDLQPNTGCETRIVDNDTHCGGCFNACSVLGGDARCVGTSCQISACPEGEGDCDGDFANGCETDVTSDTANCGGCGRTCDADNVALSSCADGDCVVDACASGWANCNGQFLDGCEQDTDSDVSNCGGCGIPCAPFGAEGVCSSGACTWTDCLDGYVDLDGDASNGCEYACSPSGTDAPDSLDLDTDCDGLDGSVVGSIFVAPSPLGTEGGAGTLSDPVDTVAGGIAKAVASGLDTVIVAQGVYPEAVVLTPGVSLYGGYVVESPVWSRGAIAETPTVIGAGTIALLASGVNVTTEVQRFRIESENATSSGANSEAVRVESSSALVLRDNVILAGDGAAGSDGADGSNGLAGVQGANGQQACDGCSSGGYGGSGSSRFCTYGSASTGGNGARGGSGDNNGGRGSNGSGSAGGSGGSGGGGDDSTCVFGCSRGGTGSSGGSGNGGGTAPGGDNGLGGNGAGSATSGTWIGSAGSGGQTGVGGSGGGGGGGGGGSSCCINDRGAGGGGGGSGGCPGQGGFSGTGGGGSFGVFLTDSDVELDGNEITSGTGGAGGRGGDGGSGGSGGLGGTGGSPADDGGRGGNGGRGGRGGAGGCGGGGGGGVSYAVYRANGSNVSGLPNNTLVAGDGGARGLACASGSYGVAGEDGDIF